MALLAPRVGGRLTRDLLRGGFAGSSKWFHWATEHALVKGSDTVTLTQELLAEMLGVRRTSVTEVAVKIQDQGVITYSRGVIKILDRPLLERMSCECYQTLLAQEATLI